MFFSLKKSVPRIFDEAMIHQEREPSNVDEEGWKRSESWNEDGWKLREEEKSETCRIVADPRPVNRTIHRANCKSRISGDWS